ncbi:MAG: hypothetical protein ABH834_04030 [Candidatus Altiarchaeota archaeon]
MQRTRERRVVNVVQLGNVGYSGEPQLEKTRNVAEIFSGSEFIDLRVTGIDLNEYRGQQLRGTWTQLTTDFRTGLKGFSDNFIDLITSEFAFGDYDQEGVELWWSPVKTVENTEETSQIAYRKLRPGGKMLVSTLSSTAHFLEEAFQKAGFNPDKIKTRKLRPDECEKTPWLRKNKHLNPYLITAEK